MVSRKFSSGGYGALADRQRMRWEITQRAGSVERPAPCVALSRLPGAGGEELGRLLAEKLDYGLFGREIVEKVAADLGLEHWVVSGMDETARSGIQRFLADFLRTRVLSDDLLVRRITLTIATLGRRGGAVIVGRGAPFILNPEAALRVLVIAPWEARVERYARVKGISSIEQAEREVALAEQQRAAFAERHFHVQQGDPLLYDFVVNTGTIRVEDAAELLVDALHRRFPA